MIRNKHTFQFRAPLKDSASNLMNSDNNESKSIKIKLPQDGEDELSSRKNENSNTISSKGGSIYYEACENSIEIEEKCNPNYKWDPDQTYINKHNGKY